MQTISLDLANNPDLKSLVADMEPGSKIMLKAAIKSKDDQSVTLTVEEASSEDGEEVVEETDDAAEDDAEEDSEDAEEESIMDKPKKKGIIPDAY